MRKKPNVKTLMDSQHVKGSKHCLNLHASIFVIFFDHSEKISPRKVLS